MAVTEEADLRRARIEYRLKEKAALRPKPGAYVLDPKEKAEQDIEYMLSR